MTSLPIDTTIGAIAIQQQRLDGVSSVNTKDDARETAKQFEALLLKTMLKSMRASTPGDSLLNNDQTNLYFDMLDQQIAQEISKSGSFGLQDSIYQQLAGQTIAKSKNIAPVDTLPQRSSIGNEPSQSIEYFNRRTDNPVDFVSRVRPNAKRAAHELGTSTEAVIAIAALETGWGKHVPLKEDGTTTHNLFGIKADSHWQGESTTANTQEYIDGEMRVDRARFRVYQNEQQSIQDFTHFIQANPRYQSALKVSDNPEQFLRALQDAGYATDPDYADKTISIMRGIDRFVVE